MVVGNQEYRWSTTRLCVAFALSLFWGSTIAAGVEEAQMRASMLEQIAADYRDTAEWTGLRAMSPRVRRALGTVPRESFVRDDDAVRAYVNRPLAIGHGQTISQPFIVALMTDLLAVPVGARVLEIGTGSGYQAAVLAELGAEVYTIEIVAALADAARERLARLGYAGVTVRTGDGNLGWPEQAPFDAIIVTAAGPLPPAVLDQLAPGGRLVIPLGSAAGDQQLTVVTRDADGTVHETPRLPVRFVPLTGATARP